MPGGKLNLFIPCLLRNPIAYSMFALLIDEENEVPKDEVTSSSFHSL